MKGVKPSSKSKNKSHKQSQPFTSLTPINVSEAFVSKFDLCVIPKCANK